MPDTEALVELLSCWSPSGVEDLLNVKIGAELAVEDLR